MENQENTGGFVLSLDFELMWGVRDKKTVDQYGKNIIGVREVIPRLLDLFSRYSLRCTWATVGFLFFDNRKALMDSIPKTKPNYSDSRLSPYIDMSGVGKNEQEDPFHFGRSLGSGPIKGIPKVIWV